VQAQDQDFPLPAGPHVRPNPIKAFLEVWLNSPDIACLAQYLQQLVVGQEVEPEGKGPEQNFLLLERQQ
jgi:hypothetical protein